MRVTLTAACHRPDSRLIYAPSSASRECSKAPPCANVPARSGTDASMPNYWCGRATPSRYPTVLQALPRARSAGGHARRADGPGQWCRCRRARHHPVARSDERHRARRCAGTHAASPGRRKARTGATRGRRERHGLSARSRRARQRDGRRKHLDQRRRTARPAVRDDAQPGARHRSRAGRRHGAHVAQSHAQEQCGIRPQAAVHRQRRNAWAWSRARSCGWCRARAARRPCSPHCRVSTPWSNC